VEFNVADLVERVAGNVPNREAVVCGKQRATYRHFDEKSAGFARYLLSAGLGHGDHVAIYGCNSIEFYDLTAIVKKKWILEFAAEIERRNLEIVWQLPSGTRSESIDEEVISATAKTGLKFMVYAPESGSARTLELGRLNATRERRPPHYHVALFPRQYASYVDRITTQAQQRVASADTEAARHRVARGETLWELAERYGTTVSELRRLNQLGGSRILAGQTLRVPLGR